MGEPRRLVASIAEPLLEELSAVVGRAAAMLLSDAFAGRPIYVPRSPGRDHPISAVIGEIAAQQLGIFYHGTKIDFPMLPAKRQRIIDLSASGARNSVVAGQMLCTERHVRAVLAEARGREPAPPGLFD